jgi:transposase-like protein
VHLIRASLKYVPRRQYDQVVRDLKPIYTAINADEAMHALEAFEANWPELAIIGRMWRDAWPQVIPFLAYEPEVRRVIDTTDESVKSPQPPELASRVRSRASRRPAGGMRARPVRRARALAGGRL